MFIIVIDICNVSAQETHCKKAHEFSSKPYAYTWSGLRKQIERQAIDIEAFFEAEIPCEQMLTTDHQERYE